MIWLQELKKRKRTVDILINQKNMKETTSSNVCWRDRIEELKAQKSKSDMNDLKWRLNRRSDTAINAIDVVNELVVKLKIKNPNAIIKNLFFDEFCREDIVEKIKEYKEFVKTKVTEQEYQDVTKRRVKAFNVAENYVDIEETLKPRTIDETHKWVHFKNSYGYDKPMFSEHDTEINDTGTSQDTYDGVEESSLYNINSNNLLKKNTSKAVTKSYKVNNTLNLASFDNNKAI